MVFERDLRIDIYEFFQSKIKQTCYAKTISHDLFMYFIYYIEESDVTNVRLLCVLNWFVRYWNDCSPPQNFIYSLAYLIFSWYYDLYIYMIILIGIYNHKA